MLQNMTTYNVLHADSDGVHHRGERGAVRGRAPPRLQGDNLGIPHGVSSLLAEL